MIFFKNHDTAYVALYFFFLKQSNVSHDALRSCKKTSITFKNKKNTVVQMLVLFKRIHSFEIYPLTL